MSIPVLETMLKRYGSLDSMSDYENALREILQEIILAGLSRADFFKRTAFYGGTALRIFHGLDRYSEDLDFTLMSPDKNFDLSDYFSAMERELSAFGFEFELKRVDKDAERLTESAFLKANTQMIMLNVEPTRKIATRIHKDQKLKIKFEVDVDPAVSFETETKSLYLPIPFAVRILQKPDLFAGKMHAVIYRQWRNRIKGRDFYDLQWYLAHDIPLRAKYFEEKARASGFQGPLTADSLKALILERMKTVDWELAKKDVLVYLKDRRQIDLWSFDFFAEIIQKLKLI